MIIWKIIWAERSWGRSISGAGGAVGGGGRDGNCIFHLNMFRWRCPGGIQIELPTALACEPGQERQEDVWTGQSSAHRKFLTLAGNGVVGEWTGKRKGLRLLSKIFQHTEIGRKRDITKRLRRSFQRASQSTWRVWSHGNPNKMAHGILHYADHLVNMGKAIWRGMGEGVGRGRHPVRMGQEFWRQVNGGSLGIYLSKIWNGGEEWYLQGN